jgi:hypothetical protein
MRGREVRSEREGDSEGCRAPLISAKQRVIYMTSQEQALFGGLSGLGRGECVFAAKAVSWFRTRRVRHEEIKNDSEAVAGIRGKGVRRVLFGPGSSSHV